MPVAFGELANFGPVGVCYLLFVAIFVCKNNGVVFLSRKVVFMKLDKYFTYHNKDLRRVGRVAMLILVLCFFFLAVFQVVHNMHDEPVKIWDEASSARMAIEMMETGHYFIVHRSGKPSHIIDTKPPVNIWLKVASYKIFGINELAVRFPTILAAIGTMIMLIVFSWRYLARRYMALFIIAIIGITPGYMGYHVARHGDPDALLIFFVTAYILLFFYIFYEYPKVKRRYYVMLALAIALAGLTKSVAGLAPMAGIVVFFFTQKKFYRMLADWKIHYTWISAALLFAAYYLIREVFDPGYIENSIMRELFLAKDYPKDPKHPQFSFYVDYLKNIGLYPFFYILALPLLLMPFLKKEKIKLRKLLLFGFLGAVFFTLGHSLSVTKNQWYIAPVYPFLWILIAASLDEVFSIINDKLRNKQLVLYSVITVLLTGMTWLYIDRYIKVHDTNMAYQEGLYSPEKEGAFLDKVKEALPHLNKLNIYSNQHERQMLFYIKKHEYLDGTQVDIYRQPHSAFLEIPLLVSQKELMEEIESGYDYSVIMEGEYGRLYDLKARLDKK